MAEAKINVRINASDLEALRALAERMERAAARTEAAQAEPLKPLRKVPLEFVGDPQPCQSMQADQTAGVEPESVKRDPCLWDSECEAKDRRIAKLEKAVSDRQGYLKHRYKEEGELRAKIAELTHACDAKDRDFQRECAESARLRAALERECSSHERTKFALDAWRKDRETLAAALESERAAHEQTKRELDSERERRREAESDRDDANRILADAPTTEQMNRATALTNKHKLERDMALTEIVALRERLIGTRVALERSSAEHFATRVRLRDALITAAEYAQETHDWAADQGDQESAKNAAEDMAALDTEREALELDGVVGPDGIEPTSAPAPAQPAPAATFRRRFLAGDKVALPHSTADKFLLPLDEQDDGTIVGFDTGRAYLDRGVRAEWLHMVEPATPARRNRELAFHFHRWNIDSASGSMDSVPEFARIAAQQLLRDPWEKPSDPSRYGYGTVYVGIGANVSQESKP